KKYFLFKNLDKIQFIVNSRDPMLIFMIYSKKYDPIFVFFFQILSCLFLLFISQEHLYQKLQAESIQAFKCFT
ncbi:hypothetical protein D4A79_09460, partial [Campylobacter coli]|nr:hypothetical protein [Campylobacter coli]EAL9894278.1 hypothetical protein [Campylobacter jejuni]EAL7987964.1 hypothetical protein [Campylobacter coli]EAL8775494.1 hypothetical protein [Campylobacter coli]EAM0198269.1 hypothetical protein [Campylobacter coli]